MSDSTPIKIVSSSEFKRQGDELRERTPKSIGNYETWKRFHDALCLVASRHGTVSDSPEPTPDFYFSGDWFHELSDGFALMTPKIISSKLLRDFQKVVAAHHPNARLNMGGDFQTPIEGLEILVTASSIFVSWWKCESPTICAEKLEALKVKLD